MGDAAFCLSDLTGILDTALKDISARVGGLQVDSISKEKAALFPKKETYSLVISTQGDYNMSIVLYADAGILHTLTRNMKRGRELEEGDVPIYAGEFFNILCGHIVSTINIKNHTKARFSIPVLKQKDCRDEFTGNRQQRFYQCDENIIELETIF